MNDAIQHGIMKLAALESRAQSMLTCIRLCYRCVNGPNGCGVARRLSLLPDDCRFLEKLRRVTLDMDINECHLIGKQLQQKIQVQTTFALQFSLPSEILGFRCEHRPNAEQLNC